MFKNQASFTLNPLKFQQLKYSESVIKYKELLLTFLGGAMKTFIISSLLIFSISLAHAQVPVEQIEAKPDKEIAPMPPAKPIDLVNTSPYVPGGVIVVDSKTEKKVKSAENTLVEIFLDTDGKLERASGGSIEKELFTPGDGMLDLSAAVAAAKKLDKDIKGQWAFEKDKKGNWVYELEGKIKEEGIEKEIELTIDAKTGRLVNEEMDE